MYAIVISFVDELRSVRQALGMKRVWFSVPVILMNGFSIDSSKSSKMHTEPAAQLPAGADPGQPTTASDTGTDAESSAEHGVETRYLTGSMTGASIDPGSMTGASKLGELQGQEGRAGQESALQGRPDLGAQKGQAGADTLPAGILRAHNDNRVGLPAHELMDYQQAMASLLSTTSSLEPI